MSAQSLNENEWSQAQSFPDNVNSRHRRYRKFKLFRTQVCFNLETTATPRNRQSGRRRRVSVKQTDHQNRTNTHILQLTQMTCRAELVSNVRREQRDVLMLHSVLPSQHTGHLQLLAASYTHNNTNHKISSEPMY